MAIPISKRFRQGIFATSYLVLACGAGGKEDAAAQSVKEKPGGRPNTTTFSRGPGGPVVTMLSRNIKVNAKSTLTREWITAHDSLSPVDLKATQGVTTVYTPGAGYSSGEYGYTTSLTLLPREDISAIEVRFVLFDLWGNFTKTLTTTEVEDIVANTATVFTPKWRVYSENEVAEFYASLAYVARVRTKSGRVFEADFEPIVAEARKLSAQFEPIWLDPKARTSPDSSRVRPR